jgi:hypothetical protein
MTSSKLSEQSWNRALPDIRAQSLEVPRSIVESIARLPGSLLREPEAILHQPEDDLAREIRAWSSGHLARILAAPGLYLFQLPDELSDEQLRAGYLLISRSQGTLNNRYGYLFDVQDYGFDYTKEAVPVSKTRASTGFHTDSTAREYLPDLVGLLCLDPGYRGGQSLVVNAVDLYRHILATEPRFVELLSQPLYRDVITPGTVNNVEAILRNRFPVFAVTDQGLTCRYMRFWIEAAYKKTGEPMPDGLPDALDLVDGYLNDPANNVGFQFRRGDMFYINNHFLCHSRTAFEDAPERHKIRVLVRTWINRPA